MDQSFQSALANYSASQATIDLVKKTDILLLVGPTGAGKDALKDALMETGDYYHLISHTSRLPRINHGVREQDGREYHFIDLPVAKRMLDEKAFVEAKVYSGNLYGTSASEIQIAHDAGKVAVTDVEVQGVAEFKSIDPNIMAVFLLPPSFEVWQQRLQRRYGDVVDAEDMRTRLQTALDEIDQLLTTDYYFAVLNDELKDAVAEVTVITQTHTHDSKLEERARGVARDLRSEIEKYISDNF